MGHRPRRHDASSPRVTNTEPRLAHLPAPEWKGKSIFRAYAGVAALSWVAMPGRFGEESEAVLALISGFLDQPAGEAGAGSAPRAGRRRSPGAVGAPWPAPGMPGEPGMLARRLASNNVDSSFND